MSHLSRLLEEFKKGFPDEYKPVVDKIGEYIVNYIQKNEFTVKFLNSCFTGFQGVRTKNAVIICAPASMNKLGDFLYVIFHELRHDMQSGKYKIPNPLSDMDFEDFEKLYQLYWEMELDADQFAKNKIARLVIKFNIPIELAKQQFGLSSYIQNYPTQSQNVMNQFRMIIEGIKDMKRKGVPYEDIQDHPIVKNHIHKLEDFI